ncbi:MAG: cellulase family glycosylhydrolase [Clostridia bacterium]|nr:cellulase family glycosylhydrolase [Clostridia bacterium]
MAERWSEERAWNWYDKIGWLRGCNYMPANAANRIDMYQNLDLKEHLACADEELALAQKQGFNSMRIILDFTVWSEEHDTFYDNVDAYLALFAQYGISAMITLGNDCCIPKDDQYKEPHVGEQHYDWGYHGGRKRSPHQSHNAVGWLPLDDPESRDQFYEFVRETIERYKNDSRVCVWDLYNEPGNGNRAKVTLPHLKRIFEIAREIDPDAPLTSGIWRNENAQGDTLEVEQFCLDNSDVISYHCYGDIELQVKMIRMLKKYNRPIMNTEWLARPLKCNIFDLFPLFYLEKVSCFMWGFVAGKYQTYEFYNGQWEKYEKGTLGDFDFRLWYHDLYRPAHRPYDPKETELIRRICDLADGDMVGK